MTINKTVFILSVFLILSIPVIIHAQNHSELMAKADSLVDNYKYDEAINLAKQALELAITAKGEKDTTIASIYHFLGACNLRLSNLDIAENMYNHALDIRKEILGADALEYGASLEGLAGVYEDRREYPQAKRKYKQVLEIRQRQLDDKHPDIASVLNSLGCIAINEEKYQEAESLLVKAIAIMESVPDNENTFISSLYLDLGRLYKTQMDFDKAFLLYKKALEICDNENNRYYINLPLILNNIGVILIQQKQSESAIPYLQRSLEIKQKILGGLHPILIPSMCNLGDVYNNIPKKQYKADSLYDLALRIAKENFNDYHPFVSRILEQYSDVALKGFDTSKAIAMYEEAYKTKLDYFNNVACYLSEKDALKYSRTFRATAFDYLTLLRLIGLENDTYKKNAINVVLNSKGNVTDIIFKQRKTLFEETNTEIKAMFDNLKEIKVVLSELYMSGPRDQDPTEYRHQLDSIKKTADKLESELAFRSGDFKKYFTSNNIVLEDFISFMPENCILLDYFKTTFFDDSSQAYIPIYMLAVIGSNGSTDVYSLGDASEIDGIIKRYREHFQRISSRTFGPLAKDDTEYFSIAKELYGRLLKPIVNYLNEIRYLFIAPDGEINLISFAGLLDEEKKYLIESMPIHYLSSGRDLLKMHNDSKSNEGLFALGDPNYDSAGNYEKGIAVNNSQRSRNIRSSCHLRDSKIESLPGSKKEIENIISCWKKYYNERVQIYLGLNATEDNFKAYAPGNRVIHLATHGYFVHDSCFSTENDNKLSIASENPLLHTGLYFTGANQSDILTDSLGIDDGILTAYELSVLNLSGTDLIVLSACETGLGKVQQGEGVYGLRRAFQLAGGRTIISALWPVSDILTSDLMSELYKTVEAPVPDRVRQAQLDQIKKLRMEGFSDHPYNWAGFISLGDWK